MIGLVNVKITLLNDLQDAAAPYRAMIEVIVKFLTTSATKKHRQSHILIHPLKSRIPKKVWFIRSFWKGVELVKLLGQMSPYKKKK